MKRREQRGGRDDRHALYRHKRALQRQVRRMRKERSSTTRHTIHLILRRIDHLLSEIRLENDQQRRQP